MTAHGVGDWACVCGEWHSSASSDCPHEPQLVELELDRPAVDYLAGAYWPPRASTP